MTTKSYWLIRSPYQNKAWDDVLMRNAFRLHGIRNAEASRNIGRMRVGDWALFYNNVGEKALYGILEISKGPYPDPTANEAKWMAVDGVPIQTFDPEIRLETLKAMEPLADCPLITRPRLSVAALTPEQFQHILNLTPP